MSPVILFISPGPGCRALISDHWFSGFEIIEKHQPLDALKWIERGNKPHLIICSSRPGNIYGPDMVKVIRLYLHKNETPIIMTAPQMHFSERSDAILSGANAYLSSTADSDQFIDLIQRTIKEVTIDR